MTFVAVTFFDSFLTANTVGRLPTVARTSNYVISPKTTSTTSSWRVSRVCRRLRRADTSHAPEVRRARRIRPYCACTRVRATMTCRSSVRLPPHPFTTCANCHDSSKPSSPSADIQPMRRRHLPAASRGRGFLQLPNRRAGPPVCALCLALRLLLLRLLLLFCEATKSFCTNGTIL